MTTCGAEPLTTGNISHRLAAVHKVLRIVALQTPMNSQRSELELDTLMKLGVKQMCQAAVELVGSTEYTDDLGCCVKHTLKTISGGFRRPSLDSVAAASTR